MIATLFALLAIITAPYTPASYACNGSTAAFAVTFPYQDLSHVVATSTTGAGVATTLVYTTDYTLSVVSTLGTATLTLTNPSTTCPTGNTLKISRVVPLTQPTNFDAQLNFSPSLHTHVADNLEMQVQQIGQGLEAIGLTGASSGIITGTLGAGFGGNGFVGFLPESLGGTGSGSISCLPGQSVVSNGTVYSCAYVAGSPVLSGQRTNLWIISDGSSAALTSSAGGPAVSTNGAGTWSNDQNTDTSRDMLKVSITAQQVGSIGGVAGTITTMPQWLPKISSRVYIPALFSTPQTTAYHKFMLGLDGQGRGGDANTGTCQASFSAVPDGGAWICLTDNNGSAAGGAYRWVICASNGNGICADTSIAATVGAHLLSVDFAGYPTSITWTIDGVSFTKTTTNFPGVFPGATQAMSPAFVTGSGIAASTATYMLSGFQVTQNF